MVLRNADGTLSWQDPETGEIVPYTGQDGGTTPPPQQIADADTTGGIGGGSQGGGVLGPPNAGGAIGGMGAAPPANADSSGYPIWSGTGNAPWAVAEAAGIPYQQWFQTYQTQQADAQKKQDIALALQERQLAQGSQATGASIANAQLAARTAANSLAEQKRQFDLGQTTPTAYQQAVIANDQAQRALQQATLDNQKYEFQTGQTIPTAYQQGLLQNDQAKTQEAWNQTLAQLGERPDSFLRYMYASRGLQTPQGINNFALPLTAPQLGQPFSFNGQPPTGATGSGVGAPPTQSAPPPLRSLPPATQSAPMLPGTQGMLTPQAASSLQNNSANPNYQQNLSTLAGQNPALQQLLASANGGGGSFSTNMPSTPNNNNPTFTTNFAGANSPTTNLPISGGYNPAAAIAGGSNVPISGQYNPNVTAQQNAAGPKTVFNGIAMYKHGGVLPETVDGVGRTSGMRYIFNEDPKKPETVVPQGKSLSDVKGKAPQIGQHYATGGTIGVGASGQVGNGYLDPSVFNPPNLGNVVNAPELAPGVPNIPSLSQITGNGASLIYSPQKYNQALPSEQATYNDALTQQFGIPSEDIAAISEKNYPKPQNRTPLGLLAMGLTGTRYAG